MFTKKRFGEKEVEAVLQRLDRLTHDEAQTAIGEILAVLYSLVRNMNMVKGGEYMHSAYHPPSIEHPSL